MDDESSDDLAELTDCVETYYRALDDHDYDTLSTLLASDFVQERPDMRLDGRDRFVQFMREERPMTETSHPIDAIYRPTTDGSQPDRTELAVRGRLLDADGTEITGFVDVFTFQDDKITCLQTFVD